MKSNNGVYQSPLNKLFVRQQPKVRAKKRMAALLLAYAGHDHKRIAALIKDWLQADERTKKT
ncbi:MAG: hypothetical protein NWQ54_20195 [Paraglaciecola sp.]|uniref:hypothetical protein n=1 Tax=Paraglaciecola sp. TaxID=1920173 RepID=UPI00273EEF1D|nr:hypothetical protein [Paraglaciecola sp.]MDP5032344.1 hypothetical protein [Paraglaciecola sp.]MDP5040934.1 hypothetical protein [Paraglaciecola sp.]MDP5133208.1 hypothetical protein [Paraglaciecola sp.]